MPSATTTDRVAKVNVVRSEKMSGVRRRAAAQHMVAYVDRLVGRFSGETSCLSLCWAVLDLFIGGARVLGYAPIESWIMPAITLAIRTIENPTRAFTIADLPRSIW